MIRLQRSIDIKSFNLEATVAVAARRPEYLAVLQLAVDLQQALDARTVHRELFGTLPDSVGRIVLDRCVLLGLFERERPGAPAHLSESGRAALASGDILIAEEGLWRIYYLDDPLLGRRLVHALPLHDKTTAQHVRNEIKARSREARSVGASLPPLIKEASGEGVTWLSLVDNRAFEIREPATRGEDGPTGPLRLHLDWSEDRAIDLALRGKLSLGDRQSTAVDQRIELPGHVQSLTYNNLWIALVSHASGIPAEELSRWQNHTGKRFLPQAFRDLVDEAIRRTMQRDLEIPGIDFKLLGAFEPTRLTGVPVVPRGNADAQEWAAWLEWDGLSTYAIPAVLRARSTEIAARFPYHRPSLRTPDALLAHAAKNPRDRKAQFLLAPADLGLWS